MAGIFYELGRRLGWKIGEAYWTGIILIGTGAKAIKAEYVVGRALSRPFTAEVESEPALDNLLAEIGRRLTYHLKNPQWRFTFRMLKSPEINGFALPGGFIFVTRSLVELCNQDPDELAFVLGHEIGHVVKRHAIEQLKANAALSAAIRLLAPRGGLVTQSVTNSGVKLLQQAYSQDKELDADQFSIRLVQRAGFDASAALRFLNRLPTNSGGRSALSRYFSSHPSIEIRTRNLKRALNR
jgi:beta-barrel assembly-enhancing protease